MSSASVFALIPNPFSQGEICADEWQTPDYCRQQLHVFSGLNGDTSPTGSLIVGRDGNIYGLAGGDGVTFTTTFFQIDQQGVYSVLNRYPQAALDVTQSLIQASDGRFYWTTPGGTGAVYRRELDGTLTTVHTFSDFEAQASYSYISEGSDGLIYGTTQRGGSPELGTIFSIDTQGNFRILHSFFGYGDPGVPFGVGIPSSAPFQGSDGAFYGTLDAATVPSSQRGEPAQFGSAIYRMDPSLAVSLFPLIPRGAVGELGGPASLLQAKDGNLYFEATEFGPSGGGSVFRTNLVGTALEVHPFLRDHLRLSVRRRCSTDWRRDIRRHSRRRSSPQRRNSWQRRYILQNDTVDDYRHHPWVQRWYSLATTEALN